MKIRARWIFPPALLVAAAGLALALGAVHISLGEVAAILMGNGAGSAARKIVLDVRLPRLAAGILCGSALSASGVVFQALLRNPLADPYILGISSGAGLGAMVAVVSGLN